jgi:hypothetical protein
MSKFLLLTTCAFGLLFSSALAQAQCTYRMNDVGRPHGYLSGPCNGAAQNYNGAYRSHAATGVGVVRLNGNVTAIKNADGSTTGINGQRHIRHGNRTNSYDAGGRFIGYGTKRGDVFRSYDARGSLIGTGRFSTGHLYDARGRYVGKVTVGR